MRNILITGGLGYVGGRLATYLRTARPSANIALTVRNRAKPLPQWASGFKILEMDLLNDRFMADAVGGTDTVVHLAGMNEIESLQDPELALEVNTRGTHRLLAQAQANGVKRFVYFSTFHVYGDFSDVLVTEETLARPSHPYATTHKAAEDVVAQFVREGAFEGYMLRISNGYGCPMHKEVNRWTLVFNDLCRQVMTSGRIVLKSSGRQYRDFISLYDVSRTVEHFVCAEPNSLGTGIYNVGGNCTMSILEIARFIADVYCRNYRKDHVDIQTGNADKSAPEPRRFTYDIGKLMRTGFRLAGNMEQETVRTLELCETFLT